jgi:hypothetical protein
MYSSLNKACASHPGKGRSYGLEPTLWNAVVFDSLSMSLKADVSGEKEKRTIDYTTCWAIWTM